MSAAEEARLPQWASAHLDACANKDIAEASTTILEDEAFERFCAILDSPMPKAVENLLARKPVWQ